MTSCSDIEAKMTPYVDGEMSASEAAAVDRHLEVCDPCRERSRVERAARTLVTDRASRLCALAPASLTARCEAAAASPFAKAATRSEPGRVSTRAWRAPLSVAAAALLLVAATFAFLRVSGQSDPLVASELARDHSNCFALAGDDGPAADLAYLEQSFERSFGWDPGIPVGLQTQGVELLEARRCAYHDGQMAHVLCRLDGQPMSLFVLPQGARPNEDLEIVGQRVIMWGTGDHTYALVGQQAGPALQRVASSIRTRSVIVP